MSESTLALSYTDLTSEVGFFLGWGRGANFGDPAWTSAQTNTINVCVSSGLRKFYNPDPPYDWEFLKPLGNIVLPVNASTVQLPDDFGGAEDVITVLATTTQLTWTIKITLESNLRQLYQVTPDAVGRPLMAALQPIKGTQFGQGQRQQLFVYPLADAEYTLQLRYYVNPDAISPSFPYPYGGAQHAETIRAAVLAAAEMTLDGMKGTWDLEFTSRLAASVSVDRRSKAQLVGYNNDRSDNYGVLRRGDWHGWGQVAVNGVVPGI